MPYLPQFFNKIDFLSLKDIANLIGCHAPSEKALKKIYDVKTITEATQDDIIVLHNAQYRSQAQNTMAGVCITTEELKGYLPESTIVLIHQKPYRAFAKVAKTLYPTPLLVNHIHPTAVIHPTAKIGEDCQIGPYVVIDEYVEIGEKSRIDAFTHIEQNVKIGTNATIYSHVNISHAVIGNCVLIKPGSRIGQAGFGFHMDQEGHFDVPQLGHVEIGDDVQIGSNTTIDRGSFGVTRIGNGVRIDNLVQIAHNVEIGDQSVLVAQVGVAGSSKLGKFVIAAGQVGIAGHLKIGNFVKIAAQSGLMRDVADNETIAGSPAVSVRDWHKQTITLQRLIQGKKNEK